MGLETVSPARNPRLCRILALVVALVAFFLIAGPAGASVRTDPPSNPGRARATPQNRLLEVHLGTYADFSRFVFQFSHPVDRYLVWRSEVDELYLTFNAEADFPAGRQDLSDRLVAGMAFLDQDGQKVVRIKLRLPRFSFRHFVAADKRSVVLDLRSGDPLGERALLPSAEPGVQGVLLEIPETGEVARNLLKTLPLPGRRTAEAELFAQALTLLASREYRQAVAVLRECKSRYPNGAFAPSVWYMLGDALYALYENNLSEHYLDVTDALRGAMTLYPHTDLAARGVFLLGLVHLKMKYTSEALGYLRFVVSDYPTSHYFLLAHLYLVEAYLDLDKPDEARQHLDVLLGYNPTGATFLDANFKLGRLYFLEGLYTKSVEILKYILDEHPDFYLKSPEILNYLGESYFHSNRPDLARGYLLHAMNIEADLKDRDILLARIGDTFREEGRHREAQEVYRLTRSLYPNSTGAVIGRLRLAEYGTLRENFEPAAVFIELEEGVHRVSEKIYRQIAESEKDSPLSQLALFKVGAALYWEREYAESLKVFKDALAKNPKGDIVPDVRFMMGQSVQAEMEILYLQKRYLDLFNLYNENHALISGATLPEIRFTLARTYMALGLPREAVELFQADMTLPEHAEEKLFGLAQAYFQMGKPIDAIRYYQRFLDRYPDHARVWEARYYLGRSLARLGRDREALPSFETAAKMHPQLALEGLYQARLGEVCFRLAKYDQAVALLQKAALALGADQPQAQDTFLVYVWLGQSLVALGKTGEATLALDEAIKLKPDPPVPSALYEVAQANFRLGRYDQGLAALAFVSTSGDAFWKSVADQEIKDRRLEREVAAALKQTASAGTIP